MKNRLTILCFVVAAAIMAQGIVNRMQRLPMRVVGSVTRQDVTALRLLGETYQNTTQVALTEYVTIYGNEAGSEVNALTGPAWFSAQGPAQFPTAEIASVGGGVYTIGTMTFTVLPGDFFGIQQYASGAKIHSWIEESSNR